MFHLRRATYLAEVQVTSSLLPVLVSAQDYENDGQYRDPAGPVLDEFLAELAVAYAYGPPYGDRLLSWREFDRMGQTRRSLRRQAAANVNTRLGAVRVHGQPPALMLGFTGLASSLLLADQLWPGLEAAVPGELVVGVPARDVVIVTGSESAAGLAKARRAVDRVFFAGDPHLLTRQLLVRRRGVWTLFRPGAPGSAPESGPREPGTPARAPMRRGNIPAQRSGSAPDRVLPPDVATAAPQAAAPHSASPAAPHRQRRPH